MADTWRRKGISDYLREADCVPEHSIKVILETYATSTDDIAELIREARKVLAYCLMMMHSDNAPRSSDIKRAVLKVRKQASHLSAILSALPPPVKDRIREAALKDCDTSLAGLGRGDPFAREDRFDDAAVAVEALARWASDAQDGAKGARRGAPAKDAPAASVAALGRFYQRLTGVAPSRVTRQAETPPYGHVENGDFGRFARDLSGLIKVRLSDDAVKRGIARLKEKNTSIIRRNSPLDANTPIDPEASAEA